MKEIHYTIKDPIGLHARPAGNFVKAAQALQCDVTVSDGDREADAKRLLAVMGLNANCGDTIRVRFEGAGEEGAAVLMTCYLHEHL